MAQVNVLVSMFFAGMNGSVVADTATVGSLLIPAMKRAGYPAAFSAGITAVSATIGGIIPPSIAMIILANAGGISVGALFAGGIIPGIMIGAMLMIINWMIATRRNFERSSEPFSWRLMGKAGARASFAMIIPIVLVGSVLGGIAGVVEAGAITAATALLVGIFIYKTITWDNCKGAFVRAFRTSATVFIIIAAAGGAEAAHQEEHAQEEHMEQSRHHPSLGTRSAHPTEWQATDPALPSNLLPPHAPPQAGWPLPLRQNDPEVDSGPRVHLPGGPRHVLSPLAPADAPCLGAGLPDAGQ